jgi:hypothetical protein
MGELSNVAGRWWVRIRTNEQAELQRRELPWVLPNKSASFEVTSGPHCALVRRPHKISLAHLVLHSTLCHLNQKSILAWIATGRRTKVSGSGDAFLIQKHTLQLL